MLFPYRESVRTITTDNGCEFAAHLEITRLLSIKGRDKVIVYFADSYCSWQKGAIENANKLIRKYIPKNPTSITSPITELCKSKRNSMLAPAKNQTLTLLKIVSSRTLTNFAFAVGLCIRLLWRWAGAKRWRDDRQNK